MLSEIGSNFWEYSLDNNINNVHFFWLDQQYKKQYYKSGRNAIKALCKNINDKYKKVMLPIYTCETCIQPFIDEGWEICFYCLNKDLTVNIGDFMYLYNIERPAVIFVHSYFGMNTIQNEDFLLHCKEQGAIIVEDMTQSLFSNHKIKCADYYVASFRKFMAIPDGGVLLSKHHIIECKCKKADERIEDIAITAFNMKKEYFNNPSIQKKELFRKKYNELNEFISDNNELQEIGKISKKIILSCDKKEIVFRRRKNYEYLSQELNSVFFLKPVLDIYSDKDCPLYFPVYIEKREMLQAYLSENNIYCPIIWKKPKQININDDVTNYMYSHMLCIPIDQRYDISDMKRLVSVLYKYSC